MFIFQVLQEAYDRFSDEDGVVTNGLTVSSSPAFESNENLAILRHCGLHSAKHYSNDSFRYVAVQETKRQLPA